MTFGNFNISEFAKEHGLQYNTVYYQMKRGYCKWPQKRRDMSNDSSEALYPTWKQMMARCYNKTNKAYAGYGARGIQVCDRWHIFANFLEDMGERPEGMTLDRINNSGNYCPDNCRWADKSTQAFNIRNTPDRGVRLTKNKKQWEARCTYKGKYIYIGRFSTKEKAKNAWEEKVLDMYGYIPDTE